MTRSLVAFSRWSLTPGTLLLETIRASDCGRPWRVVAQTRGRPRQVLLYTLHDYITTSDIDTEYNAMH